MISGLLVLDFLIRVTVIDLLRFGSEFVEGLVFVNHGDDVMNLNYNKNWTLIVFSIIFYWG